LNFIANNLLNIDYQLNINIFFKFLSCSNAKSLKYFENELCAYGFIRINHDIIVNTKYMKEIKCISQKSKILILANNIEFNISYRKWAKIKKELNL
jgi:DNA-binding LytR/AlgR family response regulator